MQISNQQTGFNINNNRQNFTGYGTGPKTLITKRSPEHVAKECTYIAHVIGEQTQKITDLLKDAPQKRIAFMESLTTSFNSRNHMFSGNLRENPESLINIYNLVEKPEVGHLNIISRSEMPFETLEKIFANARDKKSVEFVQVMQHDVLDGSKASGEHIVKMLKSPNRKEYIKHPDEYSAYMKVNAENKNAVDELDVMLAAGKYDRTVYDAKLSVQNMMKNIRIKSVLGNDKAFLERNYSPASEAFVNKFFGEYLSANHEVSIYDHVDIKHMYETSNPENIKTRLEVIDKLKNENKEYITNQSDIYSMRLLFDKMDEDRYAAEFVEKALGDGIKIQSAEELLSVMAVIPPIKAAVFHKNISRIVANTNFEERPNALIENIENPHYINPRVEKENANALRSPRKITFIEKLFKTVENSMNKSKYERYTKFEKLRAENEGPIQFIEYVPPKPQEAESTKSVSSIPKMVSVVKENPAAKKLRIKSEVNSVIEQKLGEKTLEKQQGIFSAKATVMRLKMLPEIFESISATRKSQKAMGKNPSVANRDAVKLYERIQGKNKKLVRYMLRKTDANGNRMFSVKDIIKVLDESEAKISEMKGANPQLRAKDAKAYYDSVFESMVDKYGPAKRKIAAK